MMIRNESDLRQAMELDTETEHVEFKEAKNRYDFDELTKYCCALANEGGGSIILGVTDRKPRRIVGTTAFDPPDSRKQSLFNRLRWRVEVAEILSVDGRVLAFNVPGRPSGLPLHYDGRYWMRIGSELKPMSPEQLTTILREATPDYSAEIVDAASDRDLDHRAVETFRSLWARKSGGAEVSSWPVSELLENSGLVVEDRLTYAALILLGTSEALRRHLAQAELVYEYRSAEGVTEYQQRREFRAGFLAWSDDIWSLINLRNDVQQFRDGLFQYDIPTFGEDTVREAILNALCHREYRDGGSIWVRQYPRLLEVENPGGFPAGITPANILTRQKPRNRRIAEALALSGFVERSGQGVDRMFKQSIRQGKPLPDYAASDASTVVLRLRGEVGDPRFVRFLEQIGNETLSHFSVQDFLVVDHVHREEAVPDALAGHVSKLLDSGIIERVGRRRFILSRRFFAHLGRAGTYTRKRGLDFETEKELLAKHIRDSGGRGVPMGELLQVLPNRDRTHVKRLLGALRDEGRAHVRGTTRAARWFEGASSPGRLD